MFTRSCSTTIVVRWKNGTPKKFVFLCCDAASAWSHNALPSLCKLARLDDKPNASPTSGSGSGFTRSNKKCKFLLTSAPLHTTYWGIAAGGHYSWPPTANMLGVPIGFCRYYGH
jgi:hypothetical protein